MSDVIYNEFTNIRVVSSSKVTFTNMYEFVKNGKIIASIDCEFDFKDCPSEQISLMLSIIKSKGMRIYLNTDPVLLTRTDPVPNSEFPKNRKTKRWVSIKKLFGIK